MTASTTDIQDGDEDDDIIGTVHGITDLAWDDEGDTYQITAERDEIDGRRYHFLVAQWESGTEGATTLRVDLDAAGWRELAALATTMAALVEEYASR